MRGRGLARSTLVALAVLVAGGSAALGQASTGAGFQVVVNAANPLEELPVDTLARIYMKRRSTFQDGSPARPIDLPETSRVRRAFSLAIHGKPAEAIANYWRREIFAGRAVPPVVYASETEVLAEVRRTPGAIGYVAPGATLGPGVKALRLVESP